MHYFKNNSNFRTHRSLVKKYIDSLNRNPNRKTLETSPEIKDKEVRFASMLMVDPIRPKAFSSHFWDDPQLKEIEKF